MNRKIIISINSAWNICNFRVGLIRALQDHGYEVVALAPADAYAAQVRALGCRFVSLPMQAHGIDPWQNFLLLLCYLRALRRERPLAYLGYTIKPNVFGSLAARVLGIPTINNIAGLGATFIRRSVLTCIVRGLYRLSLHGAHRVFFQNEDDHRLFCDTGLVARDISARLPGSGIDLRRFEATPPAELAGRPFRFLLVARLLKDKGIREFVDAARQLNRDGTAAAQRICFQLLGPLDPCNPNGITAAELVAWQREGLISYLGMSDDVRPYLARADCLVLPSYREGLSRALLEGAAMQRPLITTDTAGCRDVVEHGLNGLLCRPHDAVDLADKMRQMLHLSPGQRAQMGLAGRSKVQAEFEEKLVIQHYLDALQELDRSAPQAAKEVNKPRLA